LAATSAFAQSSVEVYGIIDQSVGQVKSKYSENGFTNKVAAQTTGNQSGLATQRIGFRGTEDMGNGTKAIFQIENSLSAGNAADNGFGSRATFVGLSNANMGTLTLGRQDTPMLKAVLPQLAGGANNTVGQIMWSSFTRDRGMAAVANANGGFSRVASQTTINRAINYKSATFNGVDAEIQYGKDGTQADQTGALQDKDQSTDLGFNIKYASGPLTLNAAQHDTKAIANSAEAAKNKGTYLGATYDLGSAKLSVQHGSDKRTSAGAQEYKNTGTQFGVQVPVNAQVATFASFGTGKREYGAANPDSFKQTSMQLGATYSLSKRTKLYGIYGSQQLKGNSVDTTGMKLKETQYVFGVSHSF
jgi:predicted porin